MVLDKNFLFIQLYLDYINFRLIKLSTSITDIPDWLRLYSRAPYELDHLLEV